MLDPKVRDGAFFVSRQETQADAENQHSIGCSIGCEREAVSREDLVDITLKLQEASALISQALRRKDGR